MNEAFIILSLIASFSLIIFMVANKRNLGIAIILGSFVMSFPFLKNFPIIVYETIFDYKVISLIVVVMLIYLLATILQESGQIEKLIHFLRSRLSYKGTLIVIPSILGLLPVPGGALLSAPMIKEHGEKAGMQIEEMTFLNLWYRHIWFLIFPLATPLVLLSDLSGENIFKIILFQLPIFLLCFFYGFLFIKRFSGGKEKSKEGSLKAFIPILIPVSIAIPLSFFTSTYISFLISLPIGIIFAMHFAKWKTSFLKKGISINLAVAVFGIMLLKNVVSHANIAYIISKHASFFPPIIIIACLSFIVGILTAHNLAAVGILYPILEPFIGNIEMVSFLFVSSFLGYLVSPLHLCVALTHEYFKPSFIDLYKLLIPSAILILIISSIFYTMLLLIL